jgi:hypothetical protein
MITHQNALAEALKILEIHGLTIYEITLWDFERWKKNRMTHVCVMCGPHQNAFRYNERERLVTEKRSDARHLRRHGRHHRIGTIWNMHAHKYVVDWIEQEALRGKPLPYVLLYPPRIPRSHRRADAREHTY